MNLQQIISLSLAQRAQKMSSVIVFGNGWYIYHVLFQLFSHGPVLFAVKHREDPFLCRTLVIMCKHYFLDLIYCFAFVDHASTFQAIVAHDSVLL